MPGVAFMLVLLVVAATANAEPVSGIAFQSDDIRALQADDFQNPGMLQVDAGERLFLQKTGSKNKACADCHSDMAGVAARYPGFNQRTGQLLSLTAQIQICQSDHQGTVAAEYESEHALALTAYVAVQSRGQPMQSVPEFLSADLAAGQRYFERRKGQLNLACHHCHESSVGLMLRGDKISEGHGNGYPAYRLEWEGIGSLHRRLRACDIGVRAEPQQPGSEVYTQVELFLRDRAAGLPLETPAVRR